MKSRFVKNLALVLAIVLCFGAAGCRTQSKGEKPDTTLGKETPGNTEPVKLKMFARLSPSDPAAGDKLLIEALEKDLNVDLEIEAPPTTSYDERLKLLLAGGGTYPDIIGFQSLDETFKNTVKSGLVVPINDYIKQCENLQKYIYDFSWDALKINEDDKIFAIPKLTVLRNEGFQYKKNWLDRVGLKVTNNAVTLDEFTEILRRFTFNDPDKNGKKDTYGMGSYADANKMLFVPLAIDAAFGNYGWQKSSGKYSYMTPKYDKESGIYKKELEYIAKLYKEGLMDPDSVLITSNESNSRFVKGIVGALGKIASDTYLEGTRKEEFIKQSNDPETALDYLWIKNDKGEVKGTYPGNALFGFFAITKDCKNPLMAARVFDWFLGDKGWELVIGGFEGVTYTKEANGTRSIIKNSFGWATQFMRRKDNTDININPYNTSEENKKVVLPLFQRSLDTFIPSLDLGYTPNAATRPDYMEFQKTYNQTLTEIMIGKLPVSAYDKVLDDWYKNGGEEYIKQMCAYIEKIQASKKN